MMIPTITQKPVVRERVSACIKLYEKEGADAFIVQLHQQILKCKIRFPLLEFGAKEIYDATPEPEQMEITDKIISLHTIGSNVLAGIILQLRLPLHYKQSIDKAVEYIIDGNEWYVCDIIGERVMGYALLSYPEETIHQLQELSHHQNKWIVRSVGVAAHYAIKKGLKKIYVEQMFALLLSLSTTTDFHTKKGIGWAVKTTAKFYPDIITNHKKEIEENENIKQWFHTKIKIGLSRSFKYATKYPG